ncbi:MAG: hypothetical protein ACXWPI_19445 [Ktedonobacterales bacterium]
MRQPERQEPSDDLQVEVIPLRDHNSESTSAAAQARSLFTPHRLPQARTVRLGALLVTVLLAVLLLASIPALGEGALRLMGQPAGIRAPIATRTPNDSLFYLVPNPAGVAVSLDGKLLGSLPLPGSGHPLRLAPGTHMLRWTSQRFPFHPLACRISVPRTAADTCPIVAQQVNPTGIADEPGTIIGMHASMNALAAADQQALMLAIQTALAAQRFTTTVRAGELYAIYDGNHPTGQAITAHQPLQATLTFTYLSNAGYPEPCILTQPAIPCRFPGQDCTQICTVTQLPPAMARTPDQTWIGAVMIHASWDYTTAHGMPIALQIGEAFGLQLMPLRIAYVGGQWQVSVIMGNVGGFDLAGDPVCDPARYLLSQNNVWSFAVNNPPPGAHMAYIPAPNPADGCAAVLLGHNAPGEEPAMFLQRFGVLRTVNAEAANPDANLPMADAYEQSLARQLLAPLNG